MIVENRATHAAFMRANLDIAAAHAWQGWLTHGPCAIVVLSAYAREGTTWEDGMTPGVVLSAAMLREVDDTAEVLRLLDEYDPRRELVFVFLREDDSLSAYRVQPPLAPPQAYAELGGQLSDFRLTRAEFDALRRQP
jgi:hypothetical protein